MIDNKWYSTSLFDKLGQRFKINDKVARAVKRGRSIGIEISTVTRIDHDGVDLGKIYLDNSPVPMNYPGRLLIITFLPGLQK